MPALGERKFTIMPATTITERKVGAYEVICARFLNRSERSSLNMSASTIDAGKPTASS